MSGNLCEHCVGYCCRHIALPIEEPTDRSDFDDIRWYLLHEGVTVFVEDGEWYIHIETPCRHLQADHLCGTYETRPQICRDYTTENCDYHSGDYGWEQHFACAEHLDAFVEEFFRGKKELNDSHLRNSDKIAKHELLSQSSNNKNRKAGRPRLGVKARPHTRLLGEQRYTRATCDTHGVPLPPLGEPE
ncbi:MAG: YkgJ family cysteine cluster protein [Phycisphaerae bacterium]|nr:YkgJ family cysteine cluster protein [Phycisphaerae bacterium]